MSWHGGGVGPRPMRFRDTATVSGGLLAQQATVFATGVLTARYLGAGGYGALGILKSLSSLLLIVTPLGLDLALLKHASFYAERPGELKTTARALRAVVAACNVLLLALVVLGLGDVLQRMYAVPNFSTLSVITMIGLIFATELQISGALYRVFDQVVLYSLIVNYSQPILRMALSFVVLAAGGGVQSIVYVNTVMFVVTFVLVFAADRQRKIRPLPIPVVALASKVGGILSESLWMAASLLIYQSIRLVDILILAALTSPQVTGSYTAMSSVAQLIQIYPNAVSQTLGPEIALAYRNDDVEAIIRALKTYLRRASIMGGYLLGGVAVFGTDLSLVFGHGFSFPWPLPVLLGLGWFVSATLAPFGYVLSMTGRHRREVLILFAGAVLLVGCLIVLVPKFQANGAALSVAIAFIAVNALRCTVVIQIIGFNPLNGGAVLPPVAFLVGAFVCRQVGVSLHAQTLLTLVLECLAYSGVGAGIYLSMLASKEEWQASLNMLRSSSPVHRP